MKKMVRTKKSTRAKKSSRFTAFTGKIGARTIFLVVIGIMATAMLIAARQEIQPTSNASVYVPATSEVPAKKPASAKLPGAESTATSGVSADASDAIVPAVDTDAKAPKPAPVTITGCLEQNDETFRLKDAAGADVPKSRSWKSGFLKKGAASIHVVDAAHRVKLTDHVGERVSVTGKLVDREMQVRSLQRVAASCS
jgi:hypothetical protein